MNRPTLYDIAAEHREIYDLLLEADGELTPETEARLDACLRQGKDKLDAAAAVWRRLSAEAEFLGAEEQRIEARRKAIVKDADHLRSRMLTVVDECYGGKVKTPANTIYGQTSADGITFSVAPDADIAELPKDLVRTTHELDRAELQRRVKEVRRCVKEGLPIPDELTIPDGVSMHERLGIRFLNIR